MKNLIYLLFLFGCNNEINLPESTLNLKGNIKLCSEKRTIAKYNENLNVYIDSIVMFYVNQYFDNNKKLVETMYFDKDSNLESKTKLTYSIFGKLIGKEEFNSAGKLIKKTEFTVTNNDYIESYTFDAITAKLLSNSKAYYKNGLMTKQRSISLNNTGLFENIFKRNSKGDEIEIIYTSIFKGEIFINKHQLKYFEFDKNGNWLKRIENLSSPDEGCVLMTRQLEYY